MQTTVQSFKQELEQFHKDGYVLFRNALDAETVSKVRAGIVKAFEGKPAHAVMQGPMFEHGEVYEKMIDQPVIIDFMEEVLGKECELSSMNGMRSTRKSGVNSWHVDENLFIELPDGMEIDERIPMPVFLVNALYYLDDITEDLGPTELVPGSHRAGKHIEVKEDIGEYKGQGPISFLCNAGDCLVFNSQLWHRGAPNRTDQARYVQQVIYRKRFIVGHLSYGDPTYRVPQEILDRANPRRKRLLGHKDYFLK